MVNISVHIFVEKSCFKKSFLCFLFEIINAMIVIGILAIHIIRKKATQKKYPYKTISLLFHLIFCQAANTISIYMNNQIDNKSHVNSRMLK